MCVCVGGLERVVFFSLRFLFEASALATCEILLNQPDFVVVNKHHLPKTTTYLSVTPSLPTNKKLSNVKSTLDMLSSRVFSNQRAVKLEI